jgi:hypothetical protein
VTLSVPLFTTAPLNVIEAAIAATDAEHVQAAGSEAQGDFRRCPNGVMNHFA